MLECILTDTKGNEIIVTVKHDEKVGPLSCDGMFIIVRCIRITENTLPLR